MIFVSSFVVSVGICLTNDDDFSQLTVCAFRSTSVGSASVNVPASNWFAVDRVFLMTFVSSFLTSVGISLTNSGNILQLNVRAFLCTSDNIVSVNVPASDCLCVDWVILVIFGSSFVMYIGISLTSSDNVLADFAGFRYHFCFKCVVQCACMKLIVCGLRFSVFLLLYSLIFQGISLTSNDVLQLIVCVFCSTSACSASVTVTESNWIAPDCVFLMIFVSNFMIYILISLTNDVDIWQLTVWFSFRFSL